MKIIYHCYGGSHSSVLAAALHLNLLSQNKLPSMQDLIGLPVFDKTCDKDFGTIRKLGIDESGHEVFVLGKKDLGPRYTNILHGLAEVLGAEKELLAVDVIGKVNFLMKIGGYSSRKLGLVRFGRILLYYGTRKSFYEIVNLVDKTKKQVKKGENEDFICGH